MANGDRSEGSPGHLGLVLGGGPSQQQQQYRSMTPAEFEIYRKQVQETGGFDVVLPPGVGNCGLIYPCPNFEKNPRVFEEVNRCASKAIDVYNKEHKIEYRFLRVIKLSSMAVSGCNHYITFEANANGAAPIHFQALVYAGIPKDRIEVISCRPKPNSRAVGVQQSLTHK